MLRRLIGAVEVSDATSPPRPSPPSGPGAASSAARTRRRASAPGEHYLPTMSTRLSYEKWAEEGVSEYDTACEQVETTLAAHAERAPYVDGSLLDDLATICRVDDETVRRARREYGEEAS